MVFRQLEAFVYTVDSESFSAAAQKLHLSQPTVSAHIRALEAELHTQLIRRTTKNFEVTEAGQRMYEYAVRILKLRENAQNEFSDLDQSNLRIGVSSVPGQCILPKLIAEYHRKKPEIRIHAVQSDSLDVIKQVTNELFDVGLVGTRADMPCEFVPFARDELVIAAPNTPHYQALLQNQTGLPDMLKEPLILRTDESGTKRETDAFLKSHQICPESENVVAHINDPAVLIQCIVQGLGISILSRRMVEPMAKSGALLMFSLGEYRLIRNLYIVYRKDCFLTKATEEFIGFVKEFAEAESL